MNNEDLSVLKPPYSLEAEQSVLGAILINPRALGEVAGMLRHTDFFLEQNQNIFLAMYEMYTSGDLVDIVTVSEKLKQMGLYDETRTQSYLITLADFVPSTANVQLYAKIVYEKAMLRALIEAANTIAENCYAETDEFSIVADQAEQAIYSLSGGRRVGELVHISVALEEAYTRIAQLASGELELGGIKTHFSEIDHMLGGLNKSDLVLIAARPGVGKTALALNIASNVALKDKKLVVVFSLEMSKEQLVSRIISSEALIDSSRLRTGSINDDEWPRLVQAASIINSANIKIDDNPSITIAQMKSMLRREKGIGLVIIDYLQLMHSGSRHDSRANEVAEISRSLKIMARELDVPVIALSQLNRASEARKDRKPQLSELRESGSIEQDADVVMFLYKDEENEEAMAQGIVNLSVAKNRHGSTGVLELKWSGQYTRFSTIDRRD